MRHWNQGVPGTRPSTRKAIPELAWVWIDKSRNVQRPGGMEYWAHAQPTWTIGGANNLKTATPDRLGYWCIFVYANYNLEVCNNFFFVDNLVNKKKSFLQTETFTYVLWRTHQPQWGSPEPRHSLQLEYWPQASTGTLESWRGDKKIGQNDLSTISKRRFICKFIFYQYRFWQCLTASIFPPWLQMQKVATWENSPLLRNMTLPIQTGIDWHWLAWVLSDQIQETKPR